MLQRIREQVGSAGLIVAIVALVAALAGGAYAASGGLSGKQVKEVKKIAKSYQGKGPTGAAGSTGATGAPGAKGDQGTAGAPGKDGKSVIVTSAGISECGGRGGVVVEEAGIPPGVEVCNGEAGEEGSPWTVNGILPSGKTETGTWAFHGGTEKATVEVEGVKSEITLGDNQAWVPFSFPIRLENNVTAANSHYATDANFAEFCPGVAGIPTAVSGHFCIYQSALTETAVFLETRQPGGGSKGAGRAGGYLKFNLSGNPASGSGTWAVTAP